METSIKISENLLRFTGTLILPESLELDIDYTIGITGNCIKREQRSNQDGTANLVHTIKLIGDAVIQNKWGKNIKSKAKGSPSQKLRNCIIFDYEGEDRNQYYEQVMTKILANWQDVKNFLETL